ncbi:hypothetical protein H920_19247 [Fukomys damarensis]|uniref:Uncharacterized protein n=1 Tax=Fukomys damarensis TaxID=885580 RepID=A0A091D911_FUKDA|nr:hypothetical protein H920_19247 [Fukomys damarensis]
MREEEKQRDLERVEPEKADGRRREEVGKENYSGEGVHGSEHTETSELKITVLNKYFVMRFAFTDDLMPTSPMYSTRGNPAKAAIPERIPNPKEIQFF